MARRVRKDTKEEFGKLRKWEDMNSDCLANIFEKSGMETLIFSAPLVCKNWHTATLNPHCWKVLDFKSVVDLKVKNLHRSEGLDDFMIYNRPVIYELVKFAVDRSCSTVTKVLLPQAGVDFEDVMGYIAYGCPMLKTLILPLECSDLTKKYQCMPKLMKKWKNLEHLKMTCQNDFHDILAEVATHCKNFASLTTGPSVPPKAAKIIVTLLTKIKSLTLGPFIDRRSLIVILAVCKYLEFLDVRRCEGFNCYDEEILVRSSHIKTFLSEGSHEEDRYGNYAYFDLPDGHLSG